MSLQRSHICTGCGLEHIVSPPHKEVLNKMKLTMLKAAATHVMRTMDNDFMVRDIATPEEFKLFNNFQKLRYHGLVTPVRDGAGNRIKGRWLITRNGWAFLRGKLEVSKFVLVENNHIKEQSDEKVLLRNVAAGMMEIVTTFEYFDEYNQPVGLRPATPAPKPVQASLL